MRDLKTVLSNFAFQFEDTVDTLRKTALKIAAIFFVWFTTIFAIGIALLTIIKIAFLLFPELHTIGLPKWAY
jgi:hypothetical protein